MASANEEDVVYDEAVYGVDAMDFDNIVYFDEENEDPLVEQFDDAIFYDDIPRITHLLNTTSGVDFHGWGEFLLQSAADNGKPEIVRLLLDHGLERGVDVSKFCSGAMYSAIHNKHTETVKLLLDYGADPNVHEDVYIGGGDYIGRGDIEGYIQTMKILMDYGRSPENIIRDDTLYYIEETQRKVFETRLQEMREYVPVNRRRLRCV